MKLFRRSLLDLILLIALPVSIIGGLLTAYLGLVYVFSVFLFILGTINLFNSFEWLRYRPLFFRKTSPFHLFDTPKYLTYTAILVLLFVAILVFLFSQKGSSFFFVSFFGGYAILNWTFIRLVKSNILFYARLLSVDAFNWTYWLTTPSPPKPFIYSIWNSIFSSKKVSPQQFAHVIDLLFKRNHYYSLIQLHQGAFGHLDIASLPPAVQIRLLKSIDELSLLSFKHPNIQKKLKNGRFQFPFYQKLSLVHLTTILNLDFMTQWLRFVTKSSIQKAILMDYLNYINKELSSFIAAPNDCYLDYNAFKLLKKTDLPFTIEQIITTLTFNGDSELKETIQYAYNLLLIAHGIALNLE